MTLQQTPSLDSKFLLLIFQSWSLVPVEDALYEYADMREALHTAGDQYTYTPRAQAEPDSLCGGCAAAVVAVVVNSH